MGRRKIAIKPIVDDRNRSVTFHKRKNGLFKKAYELAVLCQADVALIVFGQKGKLYEFSSCEIHEILHRYAESEGEPREVKRLQDYREKLGDQDEDDDFDDPENIYGTPPLVHKAVDSSMSTLPMAMNGSSNEGGSHMSTPSLHNITPPIPRIDQSPRIQSQVYGQNIGYSAPGYNQIHAAAGFPPGLNHPGSYYQQSQQYYSHIPEPRRHQSVSFPQPNIPQQHIYTRNSIDPIITNRDDCPPNKNRTRETSYLHPQQQQPLYSRDHFPPRSQSVDLTALSRPRLSVQIPLESRQQRHKSEEASDDRTMTKSAYLPHPSPTTAVYHPPAPPDPTPLSSIPPSRYAGPFSPAGDIYQGLFGKSDTQYKRQRDDDEDGASEGKRSRVEGD